MTAAKLRLSTALAAVTALTPALAFAQDDPTVEDVIVVSASPFEESESDVLTGVSTLSGDELARNIAGTIGETLKKEPGVSSTFFGAGASRPIIRGQGGDRIRVLDNGIGSIDASSASPDHAVAVEPALAERIEVVRGVSVLRYGSSGSGGIVNIIDGRLPSEVPEDGIDGALRVGGTSVDDGEEIAGGVTAHAGDIGDVSVVLHGSFSARSADDYDIPGFAESSLFRALEEEEHEHEEEDHEDEDHDHEEEEEVKDTLPNSFSDSQSAAGGISFIGDKGFLALGIKHSKSKYGVPAGHDHEHEHEEEDEDHEDEDHEDEDHDHEHEEEGGVFIELDQTRYDLNGRYELGAKFAEAVQVFAGYADYEHTEFEGPGVAGTVFSNEGYEIRTEVIHHDTGEWRGASGLQYRHRDFEAIGEEAFVPPAVTDQYGIYTFQEIMRGPWHFDGALRYERTEQSADDLGLDLDFDAVSVSLGTAYDINEDLILSLTGFRSERAPTSEELFSNGPHLATSQYEVGDPDLDIETALGLEAQLRYTGDRFRITANAFYTDYEGYIYERNTGLTGEDFIEEDHDHDEDEDHEEEEHDHDHEEAFAELPAFQFTADDATFSGFEIDASADIAQVGMFDIGADAVLDYVRAETDEDGNLPRIPPLGATVGLNAENDWLYLRGEVEYAGEQDDIAEFELPTDSYTLVNFYTDVTPFADMPGLTISAAVLNATDEEARVHTSYLKDLLPLPGRNYRLSVKYSF